MIIELIISTILYSLAGILTVITSIIPSTETLPWGLDPAITFFVTILHQLLVSMPWLQPIWTIFMLSLVIKTILAIVGAIMGSHKLNAN